MQARWLAGVLLVAASSGWVQLGCMGPRVGPAAPPAAEVRRVLLVPLNFEATPSSALFARGVERVEDATADYLETALGREVQRTSLERVLPIWDEALTATGATDLNEEVLDEASLAAARSELARRLASEQPTDVVAMASVVVREGRASGDRLRWDSVTRAFPIEDEQDHPAVWINRGTSPGTSIRMTLYTPSGERFFESFTGIETVHRIIFRVSSYRLMPRQDLFRDKTLIDEAVRLSFQPYLEPPRGSASN